VRTQNKTIIGQKQLGKGEKGITGVTLLFISIFIKKQKLPEISFLPSELWYRVQKQNIIR
jgi:hypothetical protein